MLRIVPHTVPRVGHPYEHFPDGFEIHLVRKWIIHRSYGRQHRRDIGGVPTDKVTDCRVLRARKCLRSPLRRLDGVQGYTGPRRGVFLTSEVPLYGSRRPVEGGYGPASGPKPRWICGVEEERASDFEQSALRALIGTEFGGK